MNHEAHRTTARGERPGHRGHGGRRGHWLMMFACCVPMIVIVGALYFTGVVGLGFVVAALVCVAMMPLMHAGMSHGEGGGKGTGR